MRYIIILILITITFSCKKSQNDLRIKNFPKQEIKVSDIPNSNNVWIFIMAGQSNMAGRGFVEPQDTIPNKRILTINKNNELIYAKEPLHFYEPSHSGLDLGLSFGEKIISKIPDSISVLIIPTAVGGSSIEQWIENKKHRNVELLNNFKNKVKIAETYGEIKGLLWHQGESNTKDELSISNYDKNLSLLFTKFRQITNDGQLPIIIGELGSYSNNKENFEKLNLEIETYAKTDKNVRIVKTSDLTDRGDKLHFDSKSIRILGDRYAEKILEIK